MSKSDCVFGYCDYMLVSALVDGVLKFLFELLKFGLLLLATFFLAIGIFQWWDQSVPPEYTNFGLNFSSTSVLPKDPDVKKSGTSGTQPTSSLNDAKVAPAEQLFCKCGKPLQKANTNQNYFPLNNIAFLQGNDLVRQLQRNAQQMLQTINTSNVALNQYQASLGRNEDSTVRTLLPPKTRSGHRELIENQSYERKVDNIQGSRHSGPCDGPNIAQLYTELNRNKLYERKNENGQGSRSSPTYGLCVGPNVSLYPEINRNESQEWRTVNGQGSRPTPTSSPCDGPNIARIYSDLYKRNAIQKRINEMRQLGFGGSLLEKVKRANVTSTLAFGCQAYNTLSPPGSAMYSLPYTSARLPDDAAAYNLRSSQEPTASNEGSHQLSTQQFEPDRNTNQSQSFPMNQAEKFLSPNLSNSMQIQANVSTPSKQPDSTARVCRCRNPKCKRRVQLY